MSRNDKSFPTLSLESAYLGIIAGVDEVGRGPLAGPVVAAAVILDRNNIPEGINDSKKLTAKKREQLYNSLYTGGHVIAVGSATVEEIDCINILGASKLAMQRAVAGLHTIPDIALVDGNQPPTLGCKVVPVVKGDSISLSIAAASIIAKVTRDRIMQELSLQYCYYGWEKNAGYGTAFHCHALERYGVTIHHRKSFAPVARIQIIQEQ